MSYENNLSCQEKKIQKIFEKWPIWKTLRQRRKRTEAKKSKNKNSCQDQFRILICWGDQPIRWEFWRAIVSQVWSMVNLKKILYNQSQVWKDKKYFRRWIWWKSTLEYKFKSARYESCEYGASERRNLLQEKSSCKR